jgi:hypothetical protein
LPSGDFLGRLAKRGEDVFAQPFGSIVPPFERIRVDDVREQCAGARELAEGGLLALAAGNVLDSRDKSAKKRPTDRTAVTGMNHTVVGRPRVSVLCPAPFDQAAGMPRQPRLPAHPNRVPQRLTRKRLAGSRWLALWLPESPDDARSSPRYPRGG